MADLTLPTPNKTPGDGDPSGDMNLVIEAINTLNSAVEGIPAGPQGPQGEPGAPGAPGAAATITVASTNTGAPGSDAAVTTSGTPQNLALSFTIPRGATGATGATGPQGPQGPQGDTGPAGPGNSLSIGDVITGAAGSSAGASITGTTPNQVLNLTIPQGIKGDKGDTGATGPTGPQGPVGPPANLSSSTPQPLGTPAVGTATDAARGDHVHEMPSAADVGAIATTARGAVNGVASLDSTGKVPSAQLPAIAITETFVVASQAAMLALTAQVGDVAVRTDIQSNFILQTEPASTLGNWVELESPPGGVTSVDGRTGAVTLSDLYAPASGINPTAISGTAVITTDSRLSDARTPTAHAATHGVAGSDPITIANTQITGLGTASTRDVAASGDATATQVVKGDDTRLTNERTPTNGSVTVNKLADGAVTSAKIADGTIVNADVSAGAGIQFAKLENSAGLSVIGRSANTTGTVTAITAAADGDVLRRSGTTVGFGAIATAGIADGAVTSAKIADGTIVDGDINASAAIAQSKISGLAASLGAKANVSSPSFTGTATFGGPADFQSSTATSFTKAPTTPYVPTLTAGSDGVTSIDVNNDIITIVQDGRWTAALLAIPVGTVVNAVVGGIPYNRPFASASDSGGTTTITLQFSTFTTGSATSFYWTSSTPLTFVAAPAQTGNSGKFLTTDGTTASWSTVSTDPFIGSFLLGGM